LLLNFLSTTLISNKQYIRWCLKRLQWIDSNITVTLYYALKPSHTKQSINAFSDGLNKIRLKIQRHWKKGFEHKLSSKLRYSAEHDKSNWVDDSTWHKRLSAMIIGYGHYRLFKPQKPKVWFSCFFCFKITLSLPHTLHIGHTVSVIHRTITLSLPHTLHIRHTVIVIHRTSLNKINKISAKVQTRDEQYCHLNKHIQRFNDV